MINTNYQLCKRHTIALDNNAYLRLKSKGQFGESFSEVVTRLLDIVEKEDKE